MKSPCIECPFRKNSLPGWLGTFDGVEDIFRCAVSEAPFSCHPRSNDRTDLSNIDQPQCVGRLLFATQMAKSFRNPSLEKMRLELKAVNDGTEILGYQEFKQHHEPAETCAEEPV